MRKAGEPLNAGKAAEPTGRGFFQVNSQGGAEPCPFSPYSDLNIRDASLKDALSSPLFTAPKSGDILSDGHMGGCVLYEKRDQAEKIINV